ncbi:MAG TPA: cyclic nucleotide-binding domain-containing protein [Candidatus Limnocylindria bacterium]|nr:cyclic nucleotide-binding domain-containing protein [Candidatus Limnocylindria bacterium]
MWWLALPDRLRFGPFLLLEPHARERLRARAAKVRLREGEVLIEERHADDDAFLLIEGSLRVMARGEGRTLAIVAAPALVGEMAVVTDHERTATVVADTPCALLRLPGSELRRLMEEQPLFATAMRERTDLLRADAFLKRRSPLRDLPSGIVASLAARLRPRELAPDQLVDGSDDDIYLVRRGAIERLRDGQRTPVGDFVQRERGERYAAVGETWIYELRMADVAQAIVRHQEQVRRIASQLLDGARVIAADGVVMVRDDELGGTLVHDAERRAVVSEHVAALIPRLDGRSDVSALIRASGRGRGEIVEGLAMLVAAGLAEIRR